MGRKSRKHRNVKKESGKREERTENTEYEGRSGEDVRKN